MKQSAFHLLKQSDDGGQQTFSCFRFTEMRPSCERAEDCSDEAFKNHWFEDDVHYLPVENLIDLSTAFMKQNGT